MSTTEIRNDYKFYNHFLFQSKVNMIILYYKIIILKMVTGLPRYRK